MAQFRSLMGVILTSLQDRRASYGFGVEACKDPASAGADGGDVRLAKVAFLEARQVQQRAQPRHQLGRGSYESVLECMA